MDRMTSMVTFVKVAEAGGFAAASRKLNMSPSTVTMQIQALEKRLGARLLNRSTRKVSLQMKLITSFKRCIRRHVAHCVSMRHVQFHHCWRLSSPSSHRFILRSS